MTSPGTLLPTAHLRTLQVGALGYGCMGLSGSYGSIAYEDAKSTLRAVLDAGVTFFDTADFYGDGANERLVAEAISGRRSDVVVSTKTGIRRTSQALKVDGSPRYLQAACEASLRRLNVERLDLFTLARVDPEIPIEESVGAMGDLVVAGKVAHVGLSEISASTLRRACVIHPITSLQSEYSLWERSVEATVLPTCRELGVGFVAYSPLGRGFLAGPVSPEKFDGSDQRRNHPRFQPGNISANTELVVPLGILARRLDATPAQVALAWLLSKGEDIVAIPGSRSTVRALANVAAARLAVSSDDLAFLDTAFPVGATMGSRYPPAVMATLDAE